MNDFKITTFELQPTHLGNNFIKLTPLSPDDFEVLFNVASDPLIWEQHPTKNRYQRPIFEIFFTGAIESKGAFLVVDANSGNPVGSTRFYDANESAKSIKIGYTFLSRYCWGKPHNRSMKALMINYALQYFDTVIFEIGENNIRSQKAIEKLGAVKTGQETIAYAGEPVANVNFIYKIDKRSWKNDLP